MLTLPLLLALSSFSQDDPATASTDIDKAGLERHVRALASEDLHGRSAGTEGAARAAKYIAEALAAAGLEGAGAEGSFFQPIPAVVVEQLAVPSMRATLRDGTVEELAYGVDFTLILRGEGRSTEMLPIARIVQEDDVPDDAQPDQALFFVAPPADRSDWLGARGQEDGEGWGLDLQLAPSADPGKPKEKPAREVVYGAPEDDACERVFLRGDARTKLLSGEYTSIQLTLDEKRTSVVENNVVAVLRGSDPELSKEAVLFEAALDHAGPRAWELENATPGANDASACAALLELARSMAAGERPKRTTVFLFSTASPKDRYGIQHFLDHPVVPLESIVCALALERLGVPNADVGGAGKVFLTGFDRSNLGDAFVEQGLAVDADPFLEERLYARLGANEFNKRGVIGQTFLCSVPPNNPNQKSDVADAIDLDHLLACTRAIRGAADLLAGGFVPERVERAEGRGRTGPGDGRAKRRREAERAANKEKREKED